MNQNMSHLIIITCTDTHIYIDIKINLMQTKTILVKVHKQLIKQSENDNN